VVVFQALFAGTIKGYSAKSGADSLFVEVVSFTAHSGPRRNGKCRGNFKESCCVGLIAIPFLVLLAVFGVVYYSGKF
jgi:hypothetical protein